MERLNAIVFKPGSNVTVSLWVFWLSVGLAPLTMILRGMFEGWDLFEQVLLAISWFAIIETARNSVITSQNKKVDQ